MRGIKQLASICLTIHMISQSLSLNIPSILFSSFFDFIDPLLFLLPPPPPPLGSCSFLIIFELSRPPWLWNKCASSMICEVNYEESVKGGAMRFIPHFGIWRWCWERWLMEEGALSEWQLWLRRGLIDACDFTCLKLGWGKSSTCSIYYTMMSSPLTGPLDLEVWDFTTSGGSSSSAGSGEIFSKLSSGISWKDSSNYSGTTTSSSIVNTLSLTNEEAFLLDNCLP